MLPRRLYLTFHGLGTPRVAIDADARRFWLSQQEFEDTVRMAAQIERETGIDVIFTFDDGNVSDYEIALPMLRAHQRTATFFICAGRISQPGYLSGDQMREMVRAGATFGCHGYEHLNWSEVDDEKLARELADGRQAIEVEIGRPIDRASAPFGALDQRVVQATVAAGFKCLFASSGGHATADTGLIPRNTLHAGFQPERDLPRMTKISRRAWDGVYDRIRRAKYGFY